MLYPEILARLMTPVICPPLPKAIFNLIIDLGDSFVPLQPTDETGLRRRGHHLRRMHMHILADLGNFNRQLACSLGCGDG